MLGRALPFSGSHLVVRPQGGQQLFECEIVFTTAGWRNP